MRRSRPYRPGRLRALVIIWCVLIAVGAILYTPYGWWMNRRFTLDGVWTDTGRLVDKRSVTRSTGDGERTDYFLDIEYVDDRGETHRHTRKCGERDWKESTVGPLPGIEFLRDRPDVFRLPGEYTWWYRAPFLTLGSLALAALLLLWIRLEPQDCHGGGSG